MWEDVRNKSGGRWLFNLDKRERRDILDSCWLETVSVQFLTFNVIRSKLCSQSGIGSCTYGIINV